MILINLLPIEFRAKPKDPNQGKYVKIAMMVGVVFFILTLFLYVDFLRSSGELKKMEKDWLVLQPQATELNQLQTEVNGPLKAEQEFMEQFVTTQRPLTNILSWCNEFLPDSAWLEEFNLTRDKGKVSLLLTGACMSSKEKTSIEQIEKYLQDLKQKLPQAKLMLKTTRMTIADTELTQFTADLSWVETGVEV